MSRTCLLLTVASLAVAPARAGQAPAELAEAACAALAKSCARCHSGDRPRFPGGINTWNSTEFTDARNGSCYSQLRCLDCHDPHKRTGPAWSHTADWDDGRCLKCHQDYRDAAVRGRHTHHSPGSAGDQDNEGQRCHIG